MKKPRSFISELRVNWGFEYIMTYYKVPAEKLSTFGGEQETNFQATALQFSIGNRNKKKVGSNLETIIYRWVYYKE